MAKGFFDSSDGDKPVQWPNGSHAANANDNTKVPRPNSHTNGQEGEQQADHASDTSTSQIDNEQHQLHQPVLAASPELPPLPPPSPHQLAPQPLLQAQMNALSYQDTENNNVDENSNDQHYQQYTRYHHQYSNHAFVPDASVRPRRREVPHDELDHSSQMRETVQGRVRSPSHQRSLFEGVRDAGPSCSYIPEEHLQHVPHPRLYEGSYAATSRRASSGHNNGTQIHPHSTNRSFSNWIPLSLRGGSYGMGSPSPEETKQEAEELLVNFTQEAIDRHALQRPDILLPHHTSQLNPAWQRAGADLRRLADAFERTEERRQVQKMAEQVNMNSMNAENFFQLCSELFSGPGGITRERIVALFTFVADIMIFNVQRYGGQFLQQIMKWSLRFIWDHICSWVHQAGGWDVVLCTGFNVLYKTAIIVFAITGTIAFGIYISKNL